MLKIYGVPQSRAARALWMAEELGLPYEHIPTHFATGDTKKPEYLELNPNGHIPTIIDEGEVFWESMAINLYLANKYDKGLKPKNVVDEGHAIQWSFWVMTEVEPLLITVLMHRMFLPEDQRDPKAADAAVAQLAKPFGVLDKALEGRDYLITDGFTVADLNVAAVVSWTGFLGVDIAPYPNLARWLAACTSRPAAKKVLAM